MTISPVMLGRIGQSALAGWAAQVGMTANASTQDERGWDVLLQVSPTTGKGPLDRAPPEMSCMVQVKTTTTIDTSEPIALSNWWRMCTDPIPWFVLVVHVDDDHKPDGACLVHVGEAWCGEVLRRMRQLDEEERESLHKRTLSVTWSEADRLTELHGREVLRRLRESVGPDQHAYVQRKMTWYRDLGYEDRARRIKLTWDVKEAEQFWRGLADLGAGLTSIVPGDWKAKVTDVRFGIEATLQEIGRDAGDMEFRTPVQGEVTLQLASALAVVPPISCSLFWASAAFPFLPAKYDKVRLASDYVTCVLSFASEAVGPRQVAQFSFQLPATEPISLGALSTIAPAMRVIANHNEHPSTATVETPLGSMKLTPDGVGVLDGDQRDFVETLACAVDVCRWFDVPAETSVVTSALIDQREVLVFMRTSRDSHWDGRPAPLKAPYREVVAVGELFAATTECAVHLPDRAIACFAGVYGLVTACEEVPGFGARITVEHANVIVERLVVMRKDADDDMLAAPRAEILARLHDLGCTRISDHSDASTSRSVD